MTELGAFAMVYTVYPQNSYFDGVWLWKLGFLFVEDREGAHRSSEKAIWWYFMSTYICKICRFRVYTPLSDKFIFCVGGGFSSKGWGWPSVAFHPRMDPMLEFVNPSIKQLMNGLWSMLLLWQPGDYGFGHQISEGLKVQRYIASIVSLARYVLNRDLRTLVSVGRTEPCTMFLGPLHNPCAGSIHDIIFDGLYIYSLLHPPFPWHCPFRLHHTPVDALK